MKKLFFYYAFITIENTYVYRRVRVCVNKRNIHNKQKKRNKKKQRNKETNKSKTKHYSSKRLYRKI